MRQKFIETKTIEEASQQAPWASVIVEVEGGFEAFEDADSSYLNEWRKTSAKIYEYEFLKNL